MPAARTGRDQPAARARTRGALPSITAICGNFGGYEPYTAATLADRYGTVDRYKVKLRPLVERLVRHGQLLPADRSWVIDDLRTRYNAAE